MRPLRLSKERGVGAIGEFSGCSRRGGEWGELTSSERTSRSKERASRFMTGFSNVPAWTDDTSEKSRPSGASRMSMRVEGVDLKMKGRGQTEKVEARPSEVSWQTTRYIVRCTSGFSRDHPLREILDQYRKVCERSFLAGRSLALLEEETGNVTLDEHSSRNVFPPSLIDTPPQPTLYFKGP